MDAMENVRMKEKQNLQNEINRLTIDMQSVFHRSALESVPTTTHRSSKLSSPTCKASATRWTCFNRDMHSASKHSNWIYDPASMHAARMHGPEQKSEEMNQYIQDMQRVELEQEKKIQVLQDQKEGLNMQFRPDRVASTKPEYNIKSKCWHTWNNKIIPSKPKHGDVSTVVRIQPNWCTIRTNSIGGGTKFNRSTADQDAATKQHQNRSKSLPRATHSPIHRGNQSFEHACAVPGG